VTERPPARESDAEAYRPHDLKDAAPHITVTKIGSATVKEGYLPDSFGDESRAEAEQSPVRLKLDLVYV
jgi:hypothetical protein